MVGVTMTTDAPAVAVGRTIRAGLSVRTNRSYALQISRAPVDSFAVAGSYQRPITWSTPVASAELADRPTQIDALGAPATGQTPIHVAFARDAQSDVAPVDPIRLLLTIVAP